MIDVCCLKEVRRRGQGAWMLGMKRRRHKLSRTEKEMELMVWK